MQLTNFVWLAAALGAVAHPSNHLHLHRSAHEMMKREPGNFFKAIHNGGPGKATTTTSTTAPTSTKADPPATSTKTTDAAPSATGSGSSGATYKPFCDGKNQKRASDADIKFKGNTGLPGQWGCNMMLVDASIADQYKYTSVYTNVANEPMGVVCFNKIGPKDLIDGFWFSAVSFTLAPGESRYIAFDKNTQGSCAFGPGTCPKTPMGAWAGTWVEFDFENAKNGGWSGADCSSLVAQAAGMSVPGCQVCHNGICSTIYPGGRGDNAYTAGMEDLDGIGLNIYPGKCQLTVKVGFSS